MLLQSENHFLNWNSKGLVYLLQEKSIITGRPTGLYKIGFTYQSDALTRVRQYATGNPRRLEIICSVQVDDPRHIESVLHKRFSRRRIRGHGGDEWFWGFGWEFTRALDAHHQQGTSVGVLLAIVIAVALVIILLSS